MYVITLAVLAVKTKKNGIIQWKPLNVITLGQIQTGSNNRPIMKSKWASTWIKFERVIWDLVNLDKFDSITRMIALSVIPLSPTHYKCLVCSRNTQQKFEVEPLLNFFYFCKNYFQEGWGESVICMTETDSNIFDEGKIRQ